MNSFDVLSPGPAGGRRPGRCLIVLSLVALLVLPSALLASRLWEHSGTRRDITTRQDRGIGQLGALQELLSVLTSAQSAAVAGDRPDRAPIRRATAAVDGSTLAGSSLSAARSWDELGKRVERLAGSSATGPQAYAAWSEAVDLTVLLMSEVGEDSGLMLSARLDQYYLADALTRRLPLLTVASGRMVDLSRLAKAAPESRPASIAAGTARSVLGRISADTAHVLHQALSLTGDRRLGPALMASMDRLAGTTLAMAPIQSLDPDPAAVRDIGALAAAQEHGRAAALDLARTGLTHLSGMADDGWRAAERDRWTATGLGAGAGAVAVVLLVLLSRWARRAPAPHGTGAPDRGEAPRAPDGPHVPHAPPRSGTSGSADTVTADGGLPRKGRMSRVAP
ncbi:hypothetical protein [Streptomyces sp. YS415]|uniref:hypothetical protein n=1 Tax=Streptomyces sp. YS415 TaxID=2944806 RepID=UPI0020209ACC|nr:hypothetical protein [Streptomyces sp. YS415]MCL7430327.1 hypothetical protein [Streptomyces sp. YS415]